MSGLGRGDQRVENRWNSRSDAKIRRGSWPSGRRFVKDDHSFSTWPWRKNRVGESDVFLDYVK